MGKKKTITVDFAKQFNQALRDLLEISDEAVARLDASGSKEFVCTNYRQAINSLEHIVRYVRDFAGSSTTATVESNIATILEDFSDSRWQGVEGIESDLPPRQQAQLRKSVRAAKRATRKKKGG